MGRNEPNIFIPFSRCAETDLERNMSRNSERWPGLVLEVRISIIICVASGSIVRDARIPVVTKPARRVPPYPDTVI